MKGKARNGLKIKYRYERIEGGTMDSNIKMNLKTREP
jgi:hypothetical protein